MANEKEPIDKERSFSIELKSKGYLKNITLNNEFREKILVEGTISKLEYAEFVDDVILEFPGSKGILRIDIRENKLKRKATDANAPNNSSQREVN